MYSRSSRKPFTYIGEENQEDEPLYCPYCSKVKVFSKLQPRVYDTDELPYDADQWLQCYRCGRTIPIYDAKEEGEFGPIVDVYDNPFDSTTQVQSVPKRKRSKDRRDKRYGRSKLVEKETKGETGEVHVISDSTV